MPFIYSCYDLKYMCLKGSTPTVVSETRFVDELLENLCLFNFCDTLERPSQMVHYDTSSNNMLRRADLVQRIVSPLKMYLNFITSQNDV